MKRYTIWWHKYLAKRMALFVELFENSFSTTFPECFLVWAISLLIVYGVTCTTSLSWHLPIMMRPIGWLAIQTLILTLFIVLSVPVKEMSIFQGFLYFNGMTRFLKIFILLGGIACLSFSFTFFKREKINAFEYIILLLVALLGFFLVISSNDLISLYLAIELQSLSLYVLAAFQKDSAFSTEAGLKYFILGAFSSGLLLFGSSLVYGSTGTTNFEDLATLTIGLYGQSSIFTHALIVGFLFIGTGMLFKLGAAPLHMWSPDVYEGAPTISSAFFALLPKVSILALLLKFFIYSLYDFMHIWQQMFILSSFGSMVVGAFGAFQQRKIKRLLAFSSIGHAGYMLIALAGGGGVESMQSLILYIMIYMVMTLCIWTAVLSLDFQGKEGRVQYLTDLTSLAKINPVISITIALTVFSMAGVPPLAGFCAKLYIFFSAVDNSLHILALLGLLCSCLSAFYYMRVIKVMYFEKTNIWNIYSVLDREKSLILGGCLFFIVFFFLYPRPFILLCYKMSLFSLL